jgi:hypothetical protein
LTASVITLFATLPSAATTAIFFGSSLTSVDTNSIVEELYHFLYKGFSALVLVIIPVRQWDNHVGTAQ